MAWTRAAWAGAVAFGAGWTLAGALGDAMLAGFFAGGALGGAGLAWATRRSVVRLAAAAGAGGGIGFLLAFFVVLAVWEPPRLAMPFVGAVGGGVLGLALGAAAGGARRAGSLSAAGAAAFALGFLVLEAFALPAYETCCTPAQTLALALRTGASGALGGALLGAAFGVLVGPEAPARAPPPA